MSDPFPVSPDCSRFKNELDCLMEAVVRRNPGEPEFHQAVHEVADTLLPFIADHPKYRDALTLDRMTEPDRIIIFQDHHLP